MHLDKLLWSYCRSGFILTLKKHAVNFMFLSVDCNASYTANSGFVTSLNYPKPYPNHMDCNLLIKTSTGKIITLYSYAVNIEISTKQTCIFDQLNIYDGDNNATSLKLNNRTICGIQTNLPTYQSSGNTMLLHFVTDFSLNHPGFAFTYVTSAPNGKIKIFSSVCYCSTLFRF